ncbi:hypothetical protein Tco_1120830 [Tanacetum coccineum]|uniref:Uncharacterized protein n=1 Tax=Tanacetum coccineum TaxID=301880 RepID=A0ABQ5IXI0_9ASTR
MVVGYRGCENAVKYDISCDYASIGSLPFSGTTRTISTKFGWEGQILIVDVLQTVKTDMVKHDVEVESLGKCVDEIDKPTELIGEMQLKQEDRSYVHASNELHLHVVHVVPGKHEADQHCLQSRYCFVSTSLHSSLIFSPKDLCYTVLTQQEHRFQLAKTLEEMIINGFIGHNQLCMASEGSESVYSLKSGYPSTVIDGQTSGPFSTEARIILPCGLFII